MSKLLREDLLEFKYYLDRLSMFMKSSYGMSEHFEIFVKQLQEVNNVFEEIFENLNIWGVNDSSQISIDILDKIGLIFGCYRNFTVTIIDGGIVRREEVNIIDNNEFLIYIKAQIAKQNFTGSREELLKLYRTLEANEIINENALLPLSFVYLVNQSDEGINSLNCNIYWTNFAQYSQDMINLFLAGQLTIESVGINYRRIAQNISNLGIYADTSESEQTAHMCKKYVAMDAIEGALYN